MKSSMLLLLGAAAAVMGLPAPHDYVVHERRDYIPGSWVQSKKLDGSTVLPVRIGLSQSNLDRGHDLLMEMYAAVLRLFMTKLEALTDPVHFQAPTHRPAAMGDT
jgi:hypothetical protein